MLLAVMEKGVMGRVLLRCIGMLRAVVVGIESARIADMRTHLINTIVSCRNIISVDL